MSWVEKKGRTVEEAIESALHELGALRDDVEFEVLEEPNKGLFGILGAKEAKVRVRRKEDKARYAKEFLEKLIRCMNVSARVEISSNLDGIVLNVRGSDLGVLIGRRGQTLEAIQYLVNLASSKAASEKRRILLDIENYRQRREGALKRLALRLAERVKRTGQSIELEPMNSHERRVIHLALQNNPHVYTHSEGQEPYRKIIISAKT